MSENEPLSSVESETRRIRSMYLASLAGQEESRADKCYSWAKRGLDIIVSLVALLILAPLFVVIAVLVKATSPGPAILVQERIGLGGQVFSFFKFRSMYNNRDRSADVRFAKAYIHGQAPAGTSSDGIFKPASDRRVTPLGRTLRKASLDELPQLWNVLKGDMSLVGPRPSMPYEVDAYEPWHFQRMQVLPGITGLAQIQGRSSRTFQDIVKIDIEYIRKRSLFLDLYILWRTLPVWLSGHGAR